jgi:hypothetical protein
MFTSFILNSNTSEAALQFIVKVVQLVFVLHVNSPHRKTGLRIFCNMSHCIILLQKRNFESCMTEMQMVKNFIIYNC